MRKCIRPDVLRVRFRAPGNSLPLRDLVSQNDLEGIVEILPPIGYEAALREMICADGLIVMQSRGCNAQIPAKLYEYLRAGRPILALTEGTGDTAATLAAAGVKHFAPLDGETEISELLLRFVKHPEFRQELLPQELAVRTMSRWSRSVQLAQVLEDIRMGSSQIGTS
jgi:hypothetical protein